MAAEVKLPRLGQGMESGTIVRWLKSEGEEVRKGEPLYELDTDKVTQEVESDADGVLLKIAVREGEVPVGQTIAFVGSEGEPVPEEPPPGSAESGVGVEAPSMAPAREPERERGRAAAADLAESVTEIREPRRDGRVKASPLARRIARERGIELASLHGTGPEGRIVAEDVERAEKAAPAAPAPQLAPAGEVQRIQLSNVRKTIARRLTAAWQAPVFQISMSADMSAAQSLRAKLVARAGEGARPTVTDVLTKACAVALLRHPAVNALWAEDAIELHPHANVGLAVAIDGGLVVPVIQQAERRPIAEIAAARADVVSRAREGRLRQEDLAGGTFTISNLGMYGVDTFVAVLNPPQAAILATGAIKDTVVVEDEEWEVRPLMSMTLTCDHRALDGATAAEFLREVKELLEEPGLML
jgi:pyruvate dehydrogenase E2 component (dihydrolipoyllysine-residue acetyltransferase)